MSGYLFFDRLILSIVTVFCFLEGTHFLDEVNDRPWETNLSNKMIYLIASLFIVLGFFTGTYLSAVVSWKLFPLVITGTVFPPLYGLEFFNELFHNLYFFSITWGGLPYLGGYLVQEPKLGLVSLMISFAVSINSGIIYILYQNTKKTETKTLAWRVLKLQILFWNIWVISLLLNEII
ncbi:MAG: hypothetical protein BTN85_1657 [Candidatus Methanohalarchaeum thermophilum]|uniref:Uncharacterized protein n=1 Tax=Methanohalarchaeum thermophilum TaxID=1903181 RepID=A0A1Q6DXS5_METT1|nr:MAG: hypothetical protein BTN85_1657 [Candidatus Methanohalarchaeum thermophilum]